MIFLGPLGTAAHLAAYLVMPAVFIFILFASERLRKDIRVWLCFITALILAYDTRMFIFWLPTFTGLSLLAMLFFRRSYFWKFSFIFSMLMLLAFSLQYTGLVRSQHRPRINMTNPHNWERMTDYLARSQYGQGNMIERMFKRRAELGNQFGDYPRMGMLGFWKEQYSPSYIPFAVWLFIGLWGIYFAVKMRWKIGLLILLLVFISTIGITLYMNFADGTKLDIDGRTPARLEVRDRDYFWTHGFAIFGWAIGLGIAAFLIQLTELFRKKDGLKKLIIPISAVFCLTAFFPAFGIANNYYYLNRSGEWFPYQFAHDMLMTCDDNAVLFTAGDNDTYPLWSIQETYNFRQDVKNINLSLANVDWYILHAKEVLGAPMAVERDQIKAVRFSTPRGEEYHPEKPYYDQFDKAFHYFGSRPIRDPNTGQNIGLIEMAQLVIEKVIEASAVRKGDTITFKTPIYFTSLTEPVRNVRHREIMKYLEKVGNLYKIKDTIILGETPTSTALAPYRHNVDKTYELMTEVFIYDGMKDFEFARGEFTTMMVFRYYASEYKSILDSLENRGDTTRMKTLLTKAINTVPEYNLTPKWKLKLDRLNGITETRLEDYQHEYIEYMKELIRYHPENYYYKQYVSQVLIDLGKSGDGSDDYIRESLRYLESGYNGSPESEWMFQGLLSGNVALGDTDRLSELFKQYRRQNPRSFFEPMFILASDYLDEKRLEDLAILLKGYFYAVGRDPFVFKELIKYTLAMRYAEASATIQQVYFEINPDDYESYDFLRQLFMMPGDSAG